MTNNIKKKYQKYPELQSMLNGLEVTEYNSERINHLLYLAWTINVNNIIELTCEANGQPYDDFQAPVYCKVSTHNKLIKLSYDNIGDVYEDSVEEIHKLLNLNVDKKLLADFFCNIIDNVEPRE